MNNIKFTEKIVLNSIFILISKITKRTDCFIVVHVMSIFLTQFKCWVCVAHICNKKNFQLEIIFVLITIHGLNLERALLFLTVLWIVMTFLFSRKEN